VTEDEKNWLALLGLLEVLEPSSDPKSFRFPAVNFIPALDDLQQEQCSQLPVRA
jgi:hypothetical protein